MLADCSLHYELKEITKVGTKKTDSREIWEINQTLEVAMKMKVVRGLELG